ncbi:MAG: hypothetical protein NC935_00820 [Candidatus Omnitrophica bacterium]|nr:hypothetical protein [Candidatus Omnitrophota bacterium]
MGNIFIFDYLSKLVGFFIVLFTLLIFIYSLNFIKTKKKEYYYWMFLTFLSSLGVVFSNHLFLITIFWGYLGLTLFMLINLYSDQNKASVAKKTFIIVGGSDGFLLFGILLYIYLTSRYFIVEKPLVINSALSFLSFFLIALACFAKAGCIPLHTWIPEMAEVTEAPTVAYLPASLDKLLGIYLLVRLIKDAFILDDFSKAILLILGSLTIIAAVMMALVQHNIKKLLGYHAVSQVGYMVLGLGCSTVLGLAAGLFHMLNNAIYKSCLFLGVGNVQKQSGSVEFENLSGLGKFMPATFLFVLIASLSISGIPPFNGFVSKWMVYQGLVELFKLSTSFTLKLVILFSLVSALVGSSLTLASFLKLNAGVFLGQPKEKTKEASFTLLISPFILSLLCIIFGIFAFHTILPFIAKAIGEFSTSGLWRPMQATNLIILGILLGFIIFIITSKKRRTSPIFIGGEKIDFQTEAKVSDFYVNIRELKVLKNIYRLAEKKFFDIYEQTKNLSFIFIKFLRYLHNGVLPTYLVWCLLGALWLFFIFFR